MARFCRAPVSDQGNTAEVKNEEAWDVQALATHSEEVVHARTATAEEKRSNRFDDWIVDSGCTNHLTGEKERLKNPIKYQGSGVVIIADNSRHQITHIGNVVFPSEDGRCELKLSDVYHVLEMKKNLLSVPQMMSEGKYAVFGPEDV